MVRLIVEEDGARRAFRLGEGVLTVGSGAEARLRLSSSDVAARHAEVEWRDGRATLRPLPGVRPPTVGGAPVQDELELELGIAFQVGSAKLWLQGDEGPVQSPVETPGRGRSGGRAADPAERAIKREAAIRASRSARTRGRVQRTRPRVKRGLPGWAIALIVLAAAGGGVLFMRAGVSTTAQDVNVQAIIDAAARLVDDASFETATARLDAIPAGAEVTADQEQQMAALRRKMVERDAEIDFSRYNSRGTAWLETFLKTYERKNLQGKPEKKKVRLFLKRCRTFRERWPQHPEGLAWIDRQESRFAGIVDLDTPPDFEDVAWEIRFLTKTKASPRNYEEAFRLLDEFRDSVTWRYRREADELRDDLVEERVKWAKDRIYQADYEFNEKKRPEQAVRWLIYSVIWLGDPELENEAAEYLVKIPRLKEHLESWEHTYPEYYAELLENAIVRGYAERNGML